MKGLETFDALPDGRLKAGDHVRQYNIKKTHLVTEPIGVIVDFVKSKQKWRAFVKWYPKDGELYEQFVDADKLGVTFDPLPERALEPEPEEKPDENDLVETRLRLAEKWIADREIKADANELAALLKQYGHELLRSAAAPRFCPDCEGLLKFDPKIAGTTVGGLALRGWDVCTNLQCGKGWLSERAIPDAGEWKLASGGRSVETGHGRIRVDGGTEVETLMARILKLPELELEIARLRDYKSEQEALAKESETVPPLDPDLQAFAPRGEPSPWDECKLVVNGIDLKDGDRILKINQPEPKENGVHVVRLERP